MLLYLLDNGSETESNKKFTFSMADRDDILLRFQEFTGIYDIEKCREILENHSWDLTAATNSYFEDFYSTEHPVQDPFETAKPGCKEDAQVLWKNVKEEYFGDGCKRFSENDCIEAVEKKLTIDDDLTHIERAHGYLESLFKVVDSPCLDRVPGGQTDPLLG